MQKTWVALGTGALIVGLAGCSARDTKKDLPPPPVVQSQVTETPHAVVNQEVTTMTAKVEAVDLENRIVTLRGPEGNTRDVKVGPEVKNLPQVHKGDDLVVSYYESMAVSVKKAGTAQPGVTVTEDAMRAKPGEKPAASAGQQTTITATVVGIDKKNSTATLKGPRGKTVTVKVRDPKRLEGVVIGDLVEVVYTEALAISVDKPAK